MHPGTHTPSPAARAGLSDAEIRSLVGAASTLAERLAGEVVPAGNDQVLATRRLARWKRLAANDDPAAFRRVLGTFGLEEASDARLCRLLGEVEPAPGRDLPRWAALLREIVPAVATAFSDGHGAISRKADCSIPFADLYRPIVALARQKVEIRVPRHANRLHETAWKGLERHLSSRISAVCSLALQPKFLAFMAVRRAGSIPSRYLNQPPVETGQETPSFFRAFVQAQGGGGLRSFFLQYPVAARLVAQVVLFWIDFAAEFLGRLEADADAVSARFFDRRPLGKVVRSRAGLSDPHHHGKSVLVLDFEDGVRLVYKPRPVGIDAAFCELLEWLNARGWQPPLRSLDVLVRPDYGWESFVEHTPCRNRRDAQQFYQRAGALLHLIHGLRGTDIHYENLIATTDGPVVVDLEALCHPALPLAPLALENKSGEKWVFDASVFRTNMLPMPVPRSDRARSHDLSALGALIHQRSATDSVRWKNVNSDKMAAMMGGSRGIWRTHRPHWQGKPLSVYGYRDDFINGFRSMSRLLEADEAMSAEWRSRVAGMDALATRFIKQPTMVYMAMIENSLRLPLLASGVDRSIELRGRVLLPGVEPNDPVEAAAMEVLDVPYFTRAPVTEPGVRVNPTAEADLDRQIAAIRASLGTERLIVHPHPAVARDLAAAGLQPP